MFGDVAWLLLILLGWVGLLGVYLAPTVVAFRREVINKWSVAVVNVFTGWTLIGWVIALAMAVRTDKAPKFTIPLTRDHGRYSAK